MNKKTITTLALVFFTLALSLNAAAQRTKNQLEKVWYNQEKTSKIEIYLAKDGKYYGKIIWLSEPNDKETGKAKLDKHNPEKNQRSNPVLGMINLKGYSADAKDANLYTGGTIYDPRDGKTYCGKITYKGNTLDLRGFICALPFLGKTNVWTLAEGQ
jgi:uncharacterized protein (DUF2147 family)